MPVNENVAAHCAGSGGVVSAAVVEQVEPLDLSAGNLRPLADGKTFVLSRFSFEGLFSAGFSRILFVLLQLLTIPRSSFFLRRRRSLRPSTVGRRLVLATR
jgi:hypothetical protein